MSDLSIDKSNQSADSEGLLFLWERLLKGDHESFEKVYHIAFSKLYRYGCRITSEDVTEEIIQELFIHIWKNRSSLPIVSSPISYLFRSFHNSLLNHIGRKKKNQTVLLDQILNFSYQLNNEIQKTNQRDVLQKAINKLSPQQREVIYLLYFNDLSASEVAEILSLKVRTVYNTAHNALNMLRKHLQKDSFEIYLLPGSFLLFFLL